MLKVQSMVPFGSGQRSCNCHVLHPPASHSTGKCETTSSYFTMVKFLELCKICATQSSKSVPFFLLTCGSAAFAKSGWSNPPLDSCSCREAVARCKFCCVLHTMRVLKQVIFELLINGPRNQTFMPNQERVKLTVDNIISFAHLYCSSLEETPCKACSQEIWHWHCCNQQHLRSISITSASELTFTDASM